MIEERLKGVWRESIKIVSKEVKMQYKEALVSNKFERYFRKDLRSFVFQCCLMGISLAFQRIFKGVLKKFYFVI